MDGAVISLKYDFAGVIIALASVATIIMLIVRLKRRWTVILPSVVGCIVFAICFAGYTIVHAGEIKATYYAEDKNEAIVLTSGNSAAVCDISSGSYSYVSALSDVASDNMATEIGEYVMTHYHARHKTTLDKLFRITLLREIYLPYPETEEEIGIMTEIIRMADKYGVRAEVYDYGEKIDVLDGWVRVYRGKGGAHDTISVITGGKKEVLSYNGSENGNDKRIAQIVEQSNVVIFGAHGQSSGEDISYNIDDTVTKSIFYANSEIRSRSQINHGNTPVYYPKNGSYPVIFEAVLY
jgi:hypothetical protein